MTESGPTQPPQKFATVVMLDLPGALEVKLTQLRRSCEHLHGEEHKAYVQRWIAAVEELVREHTA